MALKPTYAIPDLPPPTVTESARVLKALKRAHRYLGELKGKASSIPNQGILIDTLSLQEAKASSEIENIVTTQDELFQFNAFPDSPNSPAAKEVSRYRDALRHGYEQQLALGGLLTNNLIIAMFRILKRSQGGFRSTPGTALLNEDTGERVYIPPQEAPKIKVYMDRLEAFINAPLESCDLDPLTQMAIIHHQFESIHPFPDGNGRIGRIINVLFLTRCALLDIPILYLSRYITQNKPEYYRLLQHVRETGEWEGWLLYMIEGVESTAQQTLMLVEAIRKQMASLKRTLKTDFRFYSQDLLNNMFRHPYTRIEYVQNELGVSRPTAAKYLDELAAAGVLRKHRSGRNNYYINEPLVQLFLSEDSPR
ncbi:MAG: Fic family protein [Erythrobacter sp.]|uniref:Fic family protein n=1 Tax=Erythrobacter sp. TaxID=1042 RepID=UPI002633FB89|nr:Fic family protein [Erythrobacter sp.]MDJ0979532.1 Fic family protein [Erythrobacter sp.]